MEEEVEFLESEVIFQENVLNEEGIIFPANFKHQNSISKKPRRRRKKQKKNSIPINIPENVPGNPWIQPVEADFFDEEAEQFVPPHVILARRIFDRKMAFSLCTGNGRTLKGRDLSQVRNSILRMTGFLET